MNSKKSMKRKRNDKIRNTRKNNKKGGVNKAFEMVKKTAIKTLPKIIGSVLTAPKPFNPRNIINYPGSNKNLLDNGINDAYNQVATKFAKESIAIQSNKQTGPTVDVKKALESEKPPSMKPDDRVKFSELAGENWLPAVNDLTRKINESRKNAKYLLDLNELVNKHEHEKEEDDKIKLLDEIGSIIRFMTDEDAKKYGIDKKNTGGYIPYTSTIKENIQQLEKEATFTYNLLKNIDLSPKEIQRAYCEKWTKDICNPDDTPMMLMKKMLKMFHHHVFEAPSHTSNIKSNAIDAVKPSRNSSNPVYPVYVPGYGVSIDANATVKTVYGAIFGFDDRWLNNILGILVPIVNGIFDDIKNPKLRLDFVTLLVSNMSGKTEKEMDELFKTHENIGKLKDELNKFLKDNADTFSQEYANTQFIGISDEFQQKIKTAVIKEIKEKIAKQILTIANGLRKFERELLLFINAQDNIEDFEESLKTSK
jgi:hypothetical protein